MLRKILSGPIRRARRLMNVGGVMAYVRLDLGGLPDLPPLRNLTIREMDMGAPEDIQVWLGVFNDSFERAWGEAEFRRNVTEHPYVMPVKTSIAYAESEPVGIVTAGVFRMKPDVGVLHYVGVKGRSQALGLGKYLVLYCFHQMRSLGFQVAEMETTVSHDRSLWIHFGFGARLKEGEPWNSPDHAPAITRRLGQRRLRSLYQAWEIAHA